MIRREIRPPGQDPQWLLISQVEHARLSAQLAERCLDQFGQPAQEGSDLTAVRQELLAAILHHDDGWSTWDKYPQLDPEHHRPPSFREMPLEKVLPIWSGSIEAAAELGNLAGLIVADHFLALFDATDKETETAAAKSWQSEMVARKAQWFADWREANPVLHSAALAAEALQWLQLLDVMSLWLCSACPGEDEPLAELPVSYHFGQDGFLEVTLKCADSPGCVTVTPWRFDGAELAMEVNGYVAPARPYENVAALKAAQRRHVIRWNLVKDP